MKITSYPQVSSLETDNVFLIDGPNGTKTITASNLVSSLEEAEAGIDNTKFMTPLRTKQSMDDLNTKVNSTIDILDSAVPINKWTTGSNMSTGRSRHTATYADGKIYVIGGYGSSYLNSMEIYDIATNTWTTGLNTLTSRSNHTATYADGKIYVIGGMNGSSSYLNSMEIYNIATNTWTTGSNMSTGRSRHTATYADGKIYVIGGSITDFSIKIYNIATNTWTTGSNMSTPRSGHTATYADGKIYVIGGSDSNPMEIYDIATNTWTTGLNTLTSRSNHTATYIDDKIYIIGGVVEEFIFLNIIEIYDVASNTRTLGPNMSANRTNHTATYIDGKIYVIGGMNGSSSYLNTMETYDIATNTWARELIMSTIRTNHTATYADGKIYVIGGMNGSSSYLNSIEIYATSVGIDKLSQGFDALLKPTLLWLGSWGSGSINVTGMQNYSVFLLHCGSSNTPIIAVREVGGTLICGMGGYSSSATTQRSWSPNLTVTNTTSGIVTLTYNYYTNIDHISSLNHGNTASVAIRAIYGLM